MAATGADDAKVNGHKYDVFLSFRGADTRNTFIPDLYDALVGAGIDTFRDDDEIRPGEDVGNECLTAIQESSLAVVVLSKGFASSGWCLDELVQIMKCREETGQKVWPIFYELRTTVVEEQTGEYADAFADHEARYANEMGKVQEWRNALTNVSYLKGHVIRLYKHGDDAVIEEIVKKISSLVESKKLSLPVRSVGLDSRANAVISLLSNPNVDRSIVGICGMGGIGKTTIAKKVYNSIYDRFEGSCFLEKVGEKTDPEGIKQLRKELLSKILDRKPEKIENTTKIEERLRGKRILIVLDDVHDQIQFSKILENTASWLSAGSRIIITSRSNNLVDQEPICYQQYDVRELDHRDALQLLLLHAFAEQQPPEDILDCAKQLIRYIGGVPLALEVLGSSLSGQDVDLSIWKDKLDKLRVITDLKIQDVLEISYNSLDDDARLLFLDIACFFVGKDKDYVMSILKECGRFTNDGIRILKKRCLVKVGYDNNLSMHTLLRDMGRAIVRRESPENPGERSRIWNHEDAMNVLECKMGTDSVRGLMLSLQEPRDSFKAKSFKKMKMLQLLQLNYARLDGSCEYISKKLCWLCWHGFPLTSIPADLYMKNLVALDMRYSSLKQFSEEIKSLEKLKFLNLSHSHELLTTPDFERMRNLEKLLLEDCISLGEVHSSIGCLNCLVFLNLKGCKSLKNLPRSFTGLQALENLNISNCLSFEELPGELGNIKSLAVIILDGSAITTLPASLKNLEKLRNLSLRECTLLGSQNGKESDLFSFLPESLEILDLSNCNLPDNVMPSDLQGISSVQDLRYSGNNFTSLPDSIGSLSSLRKLWLNDCKILHSVPAVHSSLMSFNARDCPSLESINLENYEVADLQLQGCQKLRDIKGYFDVEDIEIKTVENLLKTCGLLIHESINRGKMHVINTMTQTHETSGPIQALRERGVYSIFLPGNNIPSWFLHQNEGDSICVQVPTFQQDSKIIGFAISAVYAWRKPDLSCFFFPYITVTNKTKLFNWVHEPKVAFFSTDLEQDMMWLSYWMFNNCFEKDCMDTLDTRWIFWNETEASDEIVLTIEFGYGIVVRNIGIRFLFQCDDEQDPHSNDLAFVSSATSRHQRRFLQSKPWWLTINNDKITLTRFINPHDEGSYSDYSSYFQTMMQRRQQGKELQRSNRN